MDEMAVEEINDVEKEETVTKSKTTTNGNNFAEKAPHLRTSLVATSGNFQADEEGDNPFLTIVKTNQDVETKVATTEISPQESDDDVGGSIMIPINIHVSDTRGLSKVICPFTKCHGIYLAESPDF